MRHEERRSSSQQSGLLRREDDERRYTPAQLEQVMVLRKALLHRAHT